jgi:hypothetical protein
VSLYGVQQCLFDQMRLWSGDERRAIIGNDVGGLYAMGVHPVLLNGWCRATGHTRDDYKRLLAPYRRTTTKVPRWRTSS